MSRKVKVLIVDDSALVRQMLTTMLESSPLIEVIGTARDPLDAREKIKKLNPDVLTLDIEMPKMDGVTFLKNLMRLRPMPVVMVSTLTEKGADITLESLEIGAIDYVAKPRTDLQTTLTDYTDEIIEKVLTASRAKVQEYVTSPHKLKVKPKYDAGSIIDEIDGNQQFSTTDKIVGIGASTGGTEAIKRVLTMLPANSPAIVITQHIPSSFSASFTQRVNRMCEIEVKEPEDGELIKPGYAYIAPGDKHLIIERKGKSYICRLNDGVPVNRHKPSVDVMFRSLAQSAGPNAMAILLTGMGDDGAKGMLEMHQQGSYTVAQDEDTCVVWGMPGNAVKLGAVDKELPLRKVSTEILRFCIK